MAKLLSAAVRAHWRALFAGAGEEARAERGAQRINPLKVVPAGSLLSAEIDGRVFETSRSKDFLVFASDYRFSQELEPSLPQVGDLIVWRGRTFEAIPEGDRCYSYEDQSYDEILRITTKEVIG